MQSSWRLRRRLACLAAGTALAAFGFASSASADVAIFDNSDYVDTSDDDYGSESDNVQASVDHLMIPFSTFTGLAASDVDAAIAGRQAVLIPELEARSIAGDPAAEPLVSSLRSYTDGGGTLVIFGVGNGSASELINEIAGTSVSQVESTGGWLVDAGGTRFADGPRFVPYEDHTMALLGETLPEDARAIYYGDVEAPVVVIPFGEGEIVYLGFDWFDARPRGSRTAAGWRS